MGPRPTEAQTLLYRSLSTTACDVCVCVYVRVCVCVREREREGEREGESSWILTSLQPHRQDGETERDRKTDNRLVGVIGPLLCQLSPGGDASGT